MTLRSRLVSIILFTVCRDETVTGLGVVPWMPRNLSIRHYLYHWPSRESAAVLYLSRNHNGLLTLNETKDERADGEEREEAED